MVSLKTLKLILILFVLILTKSDIAFPQSYNVTHYNEQSGLINNNIWSIAQDGEGKIWFGTKNGVSVYDGINWNSYNYKNKEAGFYNIKLTTDEKGEIWAFARKSEVLISHFNGELFEEKVNSAFFSQSLITSFIVDTINSKRFVFASGFLGEILYCYDATWRTIIVSAETKISRIYSATRKDNGIILATDKGLYIFTPDGSISKLQLNLPFIPRGVFFEANNSEGRLFVGGESFFGYVEKERFIQLTDKLVITYDEGYPVLVITSDMRGGYFLGNQFSLNFYSTYDNSLQTLGIVNGLIAAGSTSVLVDAEKNAWISTFRGASKISSRTFMNYKNAFYNYENESSALIEYQPGKILFGGNFGLSFYNGSEFNYMKLTDSLGEARGFIRVLDFNRDKDENIWVAANVKGFFIIDKNLQKQSLKEERKIDGFANSVLQDEQGIVWLATTKHLYTYNGKETSLAKDFPFDFNARKIFKLNNNKLLFCPVGSGVVIKDENILYRYTSSDINANNVFSAYQEKTGKILLGTVGGLCEIKNDSIVKCTLNNNLTIDRPIYLILKDSSNNLWFGTDLGVIRYDGTKLYTYTTKDGLAGNEINRSAGLVDNNNRVWFGTNNGASCYYKEYDSKLDTNISSPVFIKNINSQYHKYSADKNPEFENNDNDITFRVYGTSFIDEKENKIRWKLEGVDYQWRSERPFVSNEILYDNLTPGTYKLFVQMKNAHGTWGPVAVSSEFTINKPVYLKWWFILFSIILFGAVVYLVIHYFEQQKYNYFLKKEIDRVTKELKETETNYRETMLKEIHHRVKNNMQIISSLLSLQTNKETDPHLNEVIKESQNRIRSMALIHEKLYQSKKFSELNISNYVSSLIEYLKRVFLVNTAYIKVNLDIQEIFISIDTAIACGLIINELVSNSFKYAFPNNAKGTIFVQIKKQENDSLNISVKDDGVGIENISALEHSDSLGIKLVQMLVKQHQGEYKASNNDGALFEIKLLMKNESRG